VDEAKFDRRQSVEASTRFFEKSAAKNFCELAALRDAARRPIRKSFLLLFFKKEALSYFSSRTGKPAASGINEPAWT
jgi:hypothetical protein